MFPLKELLLLIFALAVLGTKTRTNIDDINAQIAGGEKPSKPVKTVVAIMEGNIPVCSGTLIGDKWVVTAGHCFPTASLGLADMTVVAGEMDLAHYRFSTTARTVGIKAVYLAKNYHYIPNKVLDFDLALVELAESLDVSKDGNIEVAALPPPGMKITGKEVQVVGWATLGTLLSIDINMVNQDQDCSAMHGQTKYFPSRMFCGGSKDNTTCIRDSSGGAIFHGWGVPVILGVVSFGKNTCESSTVYTKIDAFLPWIFQLTNIRPLDVFADDQNCKNYLDNVADPGSILYLSDSKQVMLPSLLPVQGCSVPPYPSPSLGAAVSAIVNNKLTICGGYDGSDAISKCYSLDHGRWWLQQPLITRRYYAGASMSPAGILVTGGTDNSFINFLSSTEVLTGEGWVEGPKMPGAVSGHCQVSVGSRVYVLGGSTFVYVLDGQEWTEIAKLKYARHGHSCAVLGHSLFIMGGRGGTGKSVEIFNLVDHTWDHEAAGLASNLYYGQALVHDGRLYVLHRDGEVERLAADGSGWEVVGSVGVVGSRQLHTAPVLTRQMLNC